MKIYIVGASTGEYSDRSEWTVAAYTKEEDAKAHVTKASEYAAAWQAFCRSDEGMVLGYCERGDRMKSANPMDPQFSCDYTGTSYGYGEVELYETFTAPEPIQ